MGEVYGLSILIGIVLIGIGIYTFKHPDFRWKISLSRRWYLKGGEPTDLYYENQRMGAVAYIFIGVIMILLSISMSVTKARGYVIEIDGNELRMPCTYSDMEALGYQIDPEEEIETLRATSKNLKNSSTYTVKNAEGKEIIVTFENRGEEDRKATECELIAIRVHEENGPKIKLPNGVKNGMSEEDAKSIMGKGTPRGVGGSAAEYNMKVNFDTYKINLVFDGDFRNKRVISIRVEDVIY